MISCFLSNFGFYYNLRPCTELHIVNPKAQTVKVGRCRLNPVEPRLTPLGFNY